MRKRALGLDRRQSLEAVGRDEQLARVDQELSNCHQQRRRQGFATRDVLDRVQGFAPPSRIPREAGTLELGVRIEVRLHRALAQQGDSRRLLLTHSKHSAPSSRDPSASTARFAIIHAESTRCIDVGRHRKRATKKLSSLFKERGSAFSERGSPPYPQKCFWRCGEVPRDGRLEVTGRCIGVSVHHSARNGELLRASRVSSRRPSMQHPVLQGAHRNSDFSR